MHAASPEPIIPPFKKGRTRPMPPFLNTLRLGSAGWRTPLPILVVLLAVSPSTSRAQDLGSTLDSAASNAATYYSDHSQIVNNLGLHFFGAPPQNVPPAFIASACADGAWSANGLTLACAFTGMGTVPGTSDSTVTGVSGINTATGGFTVVGYGQLPNYDDIAVAGYVVVGPGPGEYAFGNG